MPFVESFTTSFERFVKTAPIWSSLVLALSPGSVVAESVMYHGRPFEVDQLESLSGDQVKVTVHGQTFLASNQTVGQKVFRIYADHPTFLPIGSVDSEYGNFVTSLAQHGASDDALAALEGLLTSQGMPVQVRENFFSGVIRSGEGGDLVVNALRRVDGGDGQRKASCIALPLLPLHSATQAQKLLSVDLQWIAELCPQRLIQVAQEQLSRGEIEQGAKTLLFVGSFFKGTSDLAQAAESSSERLGVVREAITSGDASKFETALRGASFDPLVREYYQRTQGDSVAEFCSNALIQNRPGAVVQSLALLDFSERDNRHHELLLQALQALTYQDKAVLTQEPVKRMLVAYAAKDQTVMDECVRLLSLAVEESAQEGRSDRGAAYLAILREMRPDPSPENDELRGLVAESFVDRGEYGAAQATLKGVQTSIPWIIRFRLLLKLDRYVCLMVFLGSLVVARWLIKGLGLYRYGASAPSHKDHARSSRSAGKVGKGGKHQSPNFDLKQPGYTGLDEYADCLAKFQLQPGATLSDIKNAYRAIVKSLHPDLNPKASKHDTARFIELTKAYERLIELHEKRMHPNDKSPDNLN